MYENQGNQSQHYHWSNKYVFGIQIKYLGDSTTEERIDENDVLSWSGRRMVEIPANRLREKGDDFNRSESQIFPEFTEVDNAEFFDAKEDEMNADLQAESAFELPEEFVGDKPLLVGAKCPFWIDRITGKRGYTRSYAICKGDVVRLMSAKDCEDLVKASNALQVIDQNFSPRMSSKERLRRALNRLTADPDKADIDLWTFQSFTSRTENFEANMFVHAQPPLSDKERRMITWSGFVARAVSDHHFIEEWATVTRGSISFYHPEKRKPSQRIFLSSVVSVSRLNQDNILNSYMPGHHCLVIETLGRSVYLMLPTEVETDALSDIIPRTKVLLGDHTNDSLSSAESSPFWPFEIENPADEFLHESTVWNCKNRRILNCGKFFFAGERRVEDPIAVVSGLLRLAIKTINDSSDIEQRHAFLMSTASLKLANLRDLTEDARLVFFLNLYHVMVLHAFLVLGPPNSALQWIPYFNNIAYEANDDIFSLTELEHCIIRANMTYPTQFLSRFVLPKSRYEMAVTISDFRINFALNCGSLSNPPKILLYEVDNLSEQLDEAARLYLERMKCVTRGDNDIQVTVPRVCQWFAADFGSSNKSLVQKLLPYLPEEAARMLSSRRPGDTSSIDVRYLPYSFECRALELAYN